MDNIKGLSHRKIDANIILPLRPNIAGRSSIKNVGKILREATKAPYEDTYAINCRTVEPTTS